MTSESNRISSASTTYVESVCRAWGWSWAPIQQADDDGLDGLAYSRQQAINPAKPNDRRSWTHRFTGGLIHVQIKSGASYVAARSTGHLEIKVANSNEKRELWQKSPLPVALVYVQEEPLGKVPVKAWWVDLKSSEAFAANGNVIVPLKNRFQPGLECRKPFSRLASGQHRRLALATIDMGAHGPLPARLNQMSKGVKLAAREFYQQWKKFVPKNPVLGEIIINRTGWSHMTRVGRPVSRILTSFELLPAAARIIADVTAWQVLRTGEADRIFQDGSWATYDYVGLSAMVNWPARAPSEVMVILRRQTHLVGSPAPSTDPSEVKILSRKTWFYSVYEPGRRKNKN